MLLASFLLILILVMAYVFFSPCLSYLKRADTLSLLPVPVSKIFLFVVFGMFYLLLAFRDASVGIDTETYIDLFLSVGASNNMWNFIPRYEIGYILLNKCISWIFPHSPHVFLAVVAFIIIWGYTRFIYKYSTNVWLTTFFFLVFEYLDLSANLFRQSLALVFLLYAYDYLCQNKKWHYVFYVLLATSFHYTAITFFVAFFLRKVRLSTKNIHLSLLVILLGALSAEHAISWAFSSISLYSNYENSVYAEGGVRLASVLNSLVVCFFAIFVLKYKSLITQKNISCCSKFLSVNDYTLMYWLVMCGLLLWIMSFPFNQLGRLARYYTFFVVTLVPNVLSLVSIRKKQQYVWWIVLYLFLGVSYYLTIVFYRPNWNGFYPYSFL